MKYLAHFLRNATITQRCSIPVEADSALEARDLAQVIANHHPAKITAAYPALRLDGAVLRHAGDLAVYGALDQSQQDTGARVGGTMYGVTLAPAAAVAPPTLFERATMAVEIARDGYHGNEVEWDGDLGASDLLNGARYLLARDINPEMPEPARRGIAGVLVSAAQRMAGLTGESHE